MCWLIERVVPVKDRWQADSPVNDECRAYLPLQALPGHRVVHCASHSRDQARGGEGTGNR